MTRPDVVVRRGGAADADAVAALLDTFNREFDEETPGVPVLAGRLRRLLGEGDGEPPLVALLAGAGTGAVGLAVVSFRPNAWYDGPVGLLDELYVVPDRRNEGIGAALLAAAEAAVRSRGGELLEIDVDGEDTDARRFYERHGYRAQEPGEPAPDLRYHRDLGPH